MQYLSSFAPLSDVSQPAVMFFDSNDDLPELTEDTLPDLFREARTVLGTANQLNPVRGQRGSDYYLTFLKYLKPGTTQYANTPTATEIALNVGTPHHHTSNGSEDNYRKGPNRYSTIAYPDDRVPVLIPKGLTSFNCPVFTFYTSMYRNYQYWGYYCDGQTLTSKYQNQGVASGTRDILLSYTDFPPEAFAVECIAQTNVSASNGTAQAQNNIGEAYYKSADVMSETDETVNLSFAVMVMADNLFMRLTRGLDYEVDDDLSPGTRPYIRFVSANVEL